jgi:UDP-2,3-diacylglucosamine hydrolase
VNSWFISDLHLKDVNERNGNTLLRFLHFLNRNPKNHRLFLLGDIFDFWVSSGPAFVDHYKPLINEIAKLKKNGGEVFYFEGNHDFHVDVFWTKEFGIPVIEDIQYFDLDGLRLRLEHGDFINPNDIKYLKYRELVRHPLIEPLGHYLPGAFWKWFGENQSKKSRKRSLRYTQENTEEIKKLIRTYAESSYQQGAFDVMVTGHMHITDDYEFAVGGKKARSINLGTWLEKPRVLKIENKKIEMLDLEEFLNHS